MVLRRVFVRRIVLIVMIVSWTWAVVGQEATSEAEATPEVESTAEVESASTPVAGGEVYVVQAGDNLFRIALRYGLTTDELARANGITDASVIFVGQRLVIPASGTSSAVSDVTADDDATDDDGIVLAGIDGLMFERGITVFLEGQDIDALVSQVTQMQFSWVRMTADWRMIEAVEGEFDLVLLDEAVEKFSNAGVKILLTVTGAPDWARPSAGAFVLGLQSDYGPPDDPATFGTFVGRLATRYLDRVQAFEIWREPNLRRTWISADVTGRTDARMSDLRYIDLLREAYEALKTVDGEILVITGGLAPTGLNDRVNAIDDRVFMRALIEQGVRDVSDGIGVQAAGFANAPDAVCCEAGEGVLTHYEDERFYFLETLQTYRQILIEGNAEDVPLFVTRFGWGTSEGNTLATPNMDEEPYFTYVDLDEQVAYVTSGFELGEASGYIGGMFLYNLNGCQANQAEACYFSMVDGNNAARPVFEALQALNQN